MIRFVADNNRIRLRINADAAKAAGYRSVRASAAGRTRDIHGLIHAVPHTPIRRKLMTMILLTSGAVLLLTSALRRARFLTFRYSTMRSLSTLGQVIATNSTAALAFDNAKDAAEILTALRAEPHVVSAGLYNRPVNFSQPIRRASERQAPARTPRRWLSFRRRFPRRLSTGDGGDSGGSDAILEIRPGALFDWLRLFGAIAAAVIAASVLLAYLISRNLQRQISERYSRSPEPRSRVARARLFRTGGARAGS